MTVPVFWGDCNVGNKENDGLKVMGICVHRLCSLGVNQAQHFHFSCLAETTQAALKKPYPDGRLCPRNCYFGDGSPIPDHYMRRILELYQQHQQSFPWQRGDLLLVGNILSPRPQSVPGRTQDYGVFWWHGVF